MLGNGEGWTCTHNDLLPSHGEKTAKAFFLALPFPKRIETPISWVWIEKERGEEGGTERREGRRSREKWFYSPKDSALSAC